MSTPPDPQPDRTDPEAIRRNLAHALPAIIYQATPDMRLEFANAQAVAVFDMRDETLQPRTPFGWMRVVHPDDHQGVLEAWAVARELGQRYVHEHRIQVRGGSYLRFHAEALPLLDEHGRVLKWYGVLTPLSGDGGPLPLRPTAMPAREDIYPFRDDAGELQLLDVKMWLDRPDDPAAKRHPSGIWYRVLPVV